MKQYHVYKNINTGVNYIPFYKLTNEEGSKKEYTPYITNGIITIELTPERKEQCEKIVVNEDEFAKLSKELNIKELSDCNSNDLFENWGYVFTLELYQISDEYMKKHELDHKTRALYHNPIYSSEFGSINCAWSIKL